jgi:ParB-like chromosome segregation protein Spo0J
MYECCRTQDRRATKKEMVLSKERRTEILLNAGHTEEEIQKVTARTKKYRQRRRETLASQGEELLAYALDERANERELSVKAIRAKATALASVKDLLRNMSVATSEGMRKVLTSPKASNRGNVAARFYSGSNGNTSSPGATPTGGMRKVVSSPVRLNRGNVADRFYSGSNGSNSSSGPDDDNKGNAKFPSMDDQRSGYKNTTRSTGINFFLL